MGSYRFKISLIIILSLFQAGTWAQQSPPMYRIELMSFSDAIFSEISPVMFNEGVLFCSDRRFSAFRDRKSFEGERLYTIWYAERKDTSAWRRPGEIMSDRTARFNNGPVCIGPDGKTVYFTSEVETGKAAMKRKFRNKSGIFIADLEGMSLVNIRPFLYNSLDYNVGHPSVSSDGKYLYFASDMPGGSGNSDIYYCELINNEWGKPVNLGPLVNSQGSENYPHIHATGRLYFSSDRNGGRGKMDVYYTYLTYGKWDTPQAMPEPVNSPADDFAFYASEDLQTGFFASNRRRSDDIYEFVSTIIRKAGCDTLTENNYCYEFLEENAVKWDTIPFKYEWKFGDGAKASGSLVEHCYAGPGSYLVQLDVVNLVTGEVLYNEKSYNLEIRDIEQPYISCPDEVKAGDIIRMSADKTNLPGWNIGRYYWNFGDETIDLGKEVDKVYSRPGTYNIQLIVTEEPQSGGITRETCVCKNITVIRQP